MGAWLGRYGTTATAVFLGEVLSVAYGVAGLQLVLDGIDTERIYRITGNVAAGLGLPPGLRNMGVLSVITGLLILVLVAVSGAALIGIARRRQGSREIALGAFALYAVVMVPLGLLGGMADPPAENATIGVVVGLVAAIVVVLLAVPSTSDLFKEAEENRRGEAVMTG